VTTPVTSPPLAAQTRIVVKVGSALMVDPQLGLVRGKFVQHLASDIKRWRDQGREVILVSSGAIALGRKAISDSPLRRLDEKQAAAAIGQPKLMSALAEGFAPTGLTLAQSLITLDDTERRRRWLNARATLETLLSRGIVPVINENDTVATDEIRYGDNDRLAARVAQMVSADALILLSDVDGLYTADPRIAPGAEHVPHITGEITPEIEAMAGGVNADAAVGSGGMATKIDAAKIAWGAGCRTAIASGKIDHPLQALEDGGKATWFLPPDAPSSAREKWLRGHLTPEGTLRIDAGAARALGGGASLLPVGVTDVEGSFQRGAAVSIAGPDGAALGKGVTAYSSAEIAQIKGLQSGDVEAALGSGRRPAIIHRDDLVLG